MKRDSKKLVLNKQTLRSLTKAQLDKAQGAGGGVDSNITCDLECWYWSYFTR